MFYPLKFKKYWATFLTLRIILNDNMRLWSLHPKYLDTQGLVAVWREGLLAQKVLLGETKGYLNHPQLERFKTLKNPINAIGIYLYFIWQEGQTRGFKFQQKKIQDFSESNIKLKVTQGQIEFEFGHLKNKLITRELTQFNVLKEIKEIEPHPIFKIIPGGVESWERR
jgi:hypothetical protein